MALFNKLYSEYYDDMYADKDYKSEADFFIFLIKKYGPKMTKNILSVGTGTLNHEIFLLKKKYQITGIDVSKDMVKVAKEKIKSLKLKNIDIQLKDMKNFLFTKKKFEAVLSMFNVISYCKGLKELDMVFKSVSNSLSKDGIFIFDCWNINAVRKDPPKNPWTKYRKKDKTLYRLTQSKFNYNIGSINRLLEMIEIRGEKVLNYDTETHILYAWDIKDIKRLLLKNNMKLVKSCQFMKLNKPISDKEWNMTIIAKKI